jgi:hypothetical protein
MYCQKCGSENQAGSGFCMKCGTNLAQNTPSGSPSNVYYWSLSLMPLIVGVTGLALSTALESSQALIISLVVALLANITLVVADSNELKKIGITSNVLLGILLIPVYLYRRAKLVGSPQVGLILWSVAFTLSFLVESFGASNVGSMESTERVESYITTWLLDNEYASADVYVECPDTVLSKPQATFLCNATSSSGETLLQVTVENVAGDVTWEVIG